MHAALGPSRLLEREADLAVLTGVVTAAEAGAGQVALIRGPAGIGKTTLLDEAVGVARSRDLRILRARGTELERDLPLALVRELLGPVIGAEPVPGDTSALLHRLHWTLSSLAEERPILVCVDDAHWADELSLRFVAYLARRLEGLAMSLILAQRSEESSELLDHLAEDPAVTLLEPRPLSTASVGVLVEEAFTRRGDETFVSACSEAAGGNPLLVRTLVEEAVVNGIPPTEHGASRLASLAPEAVQRFVMRRLDALGPEALGVARAVAVLGSAAPLRHVARLADMDPETAHAAADALADAGLLSAGEELDFAHPVLRSGLYAGIPAGRRAALHRQAGPAPARRIRARGPGRGAPPRHAWPR